MPGGAAISKPTTGSKGRLIFVCLLSAFAIGVSNSAAAAPLQEKVAPQKKYLQLKGSGPLNKVVTVRVKHKDKVYYGRPLGQDSKTLALLRWDGRISVLPRQKKMEIFSKGFAPYNSDELTKRLQKQYGERYQVQTSEHFVVVYPRTRQKNWAADYESVFAQYKNYLASYKIDIAPPKFPMIVVVLGSRNEFIRELSDEIVFKKDVYGFYSRITNRVTTFVSSDPRIARQVDRLSALTIVHETIHQSAFNTGVHNRLCAVPRWMSEGFATLFESNGFRRNAPNKPASERVNKRRLVTLRKMFQSGRADGELEKLLRNDPLFDTEPDLAYSLAWGLSFYLAETQTERYLQFVIRDGNQNEYGLYTPDERVTHFLDTFAMDFGLLERRLKKFIKDLD